MTNRPHARRLTLAVSIALLLGTLLMALLGPAQTLAQTRKACSGAAAHTRKGKHTARTCATHKSKVKSKHKRGTKSTRRSSTAAAIAASCEDGSAPILSDGSFSCEDGSEPQCVDGATPKASRNGKLLLCPVATEGGSGSGEAECEEEEELECATSENAGEQACEASSSGSLACEAEGES